jgi:hypothetical protein
MVRSMLRSTSSRRALVSSLVLLLGASATTGALSGACREPTQITLEVRTDLRCADRITSAIVVGTLAQTAESLASRPPAVETTDCTESGNGEAFVGSLVVVPSGDDTGEVAIKVVAGVGIPPEDCTGPTDKRCITARRVRKYVSSTKLVLPVLLADACRGVPCGADETCSRGRCVSVRCEDEGTCDPPPASTDGGVPDAPVDAPDAIVPDATVPDAGTSLPFEIALGYDHSCALRRRDGAVFCWGSNDGHQAGQVPTANVAKPTRVDLPLESGEKIVALRAADQYTMALSDRGRLFGWGHNESGPMGPLPGPLMPVPVVDGGATAIAVGQRTSCYLTASQLRCVGQYVDADYALPAAGLQSFCVGTTYLLGISGSGESPLVGAWDPLSPAIPRLGDASADAGPAGLLTTLPLKALAVHCGGAYSLAVRPNGTVFGWGENSTYVLTKDRPAATLPVGDSPLLDGFESYSAGLDSACGLKGGKAYCWGLNEKGQVTGTPGIAVSNPTLVPNLPSAAAVYAQGSHSCAQLTDGTVYCWGGNDKLQLGAGGDASTALQAVKVQGLDP